MQTIRIKSQSDANLLPVELFANLIIEVPCAPPQLTTVHGNLYVRADFSPPQLTTVHGYLYVMADFSPPQLTTVHGYLYVMADFQYSHIEIEGKIFVFIKDDFRIEEIENEFYFNGKNSSWLVSLFKLRHSSFKNFLEREVRREWNLNETVKPLLRLLKKHWNNNSALTIKEVFEIENLEVRRLCFQYLLPGDIMKALKAKRIATKGIMLDYFTFVNGKKEPYQKHNIYEVYEADSSKLDKDLSGSIHAVKCWCSSTEKEHWLWIESEFKDDPLSAIASTFRIHENIIPNIKGLKRQGDIMLVEMDEKIIPEGKERPLTKEEYFGLLVCET